MARVSSVTLTVVILRLGKIGNLKKYNPRLPNRAINVCIVRRTFRHRNDNKRCALVTEQLALTAKCLKQPSAKQL